MRPPRSLRPLATSVLVGRGPDLPRFVGRGAALLLLSGFCPPARATEDTAPTQQAAARPQVQAGPASEQSPPLRPPPIDRSFIQFGVGVAVEDVASPGPVCPNAADPCILGSGGGVALRVAWRPTETFSIGAAYEFSKQDPAKLYRLAILQQARGELREYLTVGHDARPFALFGLGLAAYGDEWAIATWGPAGALGAGIELEVAADVAVDLSLAYRAVLLRSFTDSSTIEHGTGVAQLVGLEIGFETRSAL